MTDKPDNPPAFPIPDGCYIYGMTLRDYLAAHAPIGIEEAIRNLKEASYEVAFRRLSQMRYSYADAMLLARQK